MLLLAIFLFPAIHFACPCGPSKSFCESLEGITNHPGQMVVIRGMVGNISDEQVEISVREQIYGNTCQSKIKVFKDICSDYVILEERKEYVFLLQRFEDTFFPPSCSATVLEIENEMVTGNIAPGIESIGYQDLTELKNCGAVFNYSFLENALAVFPNPVRDFLKIKNINPITAITQFELTIFDAKGQTIKWYKKEDGILPKEVWTIDVQYLSAGIYFVKLSNEVEVRTFRIVKQ